MNHILERGHKSCNKFRQMGLVNISFYFPKALVNEARLRMLQRYTYPSVSTVMYTDFKNCEYM